MATINATTNEKIYSIKKWLGLNQSPDGDTKLKYGEAAVMRNWRVTRDGNLRRRPGTAVQETIGAEAVKRLWSGFVDGSECVLAACDNHLYELFNGAEWTNTDLGEISTAGSVFIFGFGGCAYILDGVKYRVYDGTSLTEVEGYRPLVVTASVPSGGGTSIEHVNKLNGLRRVQFSPDGASTVFSLPENNISSVDYVKNTATGEAITGYTVNLVAGSVTFTSAPETGVNTIEIGYSVSVDYRLQVERMRYAELFNGAQDSRVFLYGDGSNQVLYSGLDSAGQPRADYFPDLNVAAVGDSNTPVTALIRHGSRLIAYKTNSTYSIYYNTITLEDGSTTAGFYITPVNRAIGNVAPGQAQLVLNYPRTLFGEDCYEWKNASTYFTADERQAKRISDRVHTTLRGFDAKSAVCWDDNDAQEYYIAYDGQALVHNYAADVWYYYTEFDARSFMNFRGELYIGTSDGRVLNVDDRYLTDCGEAIAAYWESGSMDFNADYMRKYTSALWVTVKPESNSYVEITVKTDRKTDNAQKSIAKGLGFFSNMDFGNFSFNTSTRPQVKKLRIKSKKYTFYKLVFQTDRVGTTATVLQADVRVRQTGYAK